MALFYSSLQKLVYFSFFLSLLSCGPNALPGHFRDRDFNDQWEFHLGDIRDPFDMDASAWLQVHLPHDWSIMDYELQDSLHHGPFFKDLPGGADVGYLRNGTAWYKKAFATPKNSDKKRVILSFDGVQSQMELWVNGKMIGEHVYGYTPFQFDISGALKEPGEINKYDCSEDH